jgi:hypothetical protein
MVRYPLSYLIWEGILLFSLNLGSRRQIHHLLREPAVVTHLNALAQAEMRPEKVSHGDTLNKILIRTDYLSFAVIRTDMVRKLIRSRVLDKHRLLGKYYLIAIDGSGILSFDHRHCKHCLTKKCSQTGKTIYYHMVLEAKLVTASGFAFSIDTEFIENSDPNASKQDCELKAFYRMAPRLKEAFPALPICLLMDGIYANQTVMGICAQYRWKYIINFKEGSMPAKYEEFESLCKSVQCENKIACSLPDKTRQEFEFATGIEHEGHTFNVIRCLETEPGETASKQYAWMTNLSVTKDTCVEIANQGGRIRWKIENQGFNAQKNGGYHLEHAYSQNENAGKCFYILLQIAHTINQLIEKGSLLSKEARKKIGCIKNIAKLLLESIRTQPISETAFEALFSAPFQIRINST